MIGIYNKIINIIDQLKNFLGNTPMNAKQLSDLITYAFSVSDVGIIPAAFDRVNVGSITRSRGEGIRAMFVLGANEGMLPQKVADGGILTNKDKDILNTKGVGFRDTYEYLRSRDMLSIYTVMTRPGEKLYVSRFKKESDVSDTEYYSSQLFEQIKKMFSLESEPFSMLDGITSVESAFDALALYHIKNEKDEFEEIYDSIYSFFRENPEYSRFADNADTAFGFTNDAVIRDTDTFAGVIDSTRALSITRLETYAACPFRYFVNYVLRPRKKAENKVNSLDTGTILHEIIQLYTDMILEGKVEPSTIEKEEIDSVIAILTDKVISGKKYEMLNCSDYVKNKIRLSASRAALVITIQFRNSDFLMEEAEAEFNFNKKMVPVCVDIPGEGQIFLQGKIDRIDSCEIDGKKYARIIDYKTSGKEFDITNVFYGLSLQLPVYINAYNENNADAKTAGIFYLRIDPNFRGINKKNELEEALSNAVNDEFKQNGLMLRDIKVKHALDHTSDSSSRSRYIKAEETDEEGFELLIKKTNENIASLYSRLRHADISINPSRVDNQREACGICDFKDICKFSEDFGANCYKDIRKLENRNIKEVFA